MARGDGAAPRHPCPARGRAGGRHPRPAVGLTLVAVDFSQEIKDLRTTMASVREVTDLTRLAGDDRRLREAGVRPPTSGTTRRRRRVVTSGLSRAKAEHDRVTGHGRAHRRPRDPRRDGPGGDDAETLAEAERELAAVKKDVGELEVRTLLAGEYDERAAVVTIRAGAGGVDAADFAEMLMRMYLRWAERHALPDRRCSTRPTPRRRA